MPGTGSCWRHSWPRARGCGHGSAWNWLNQAGKRGGKSSQHLRNIQRELVHEVSYRPWTLLWEEVWKKRTTPGEGQRGDRKVKGLLDTAGWWEAQGRWEGSSGCPGERRISWDKGRYPRIKEHSMGSAHSSPTATPPAQPDPGHANPVLGIALIPKEGITDLALRALGTWNSLHPLPWDCRQDSWQLVSNTKRV